MGIQRKPQRSLQELLESQPGRGETRKPSQPKLPPPPPKSLPCTPQPPLPFRIEQVDPKRRREPKGKEVMEPGRPRSSSEEEAHRPFKQQRTQPRIRKGRCSIARAPSMAPNSHVWWWAPDRRCINQGLQWGHRLSRCLNSRGNSPAPQRHGGVTWI